MSKDARNVKLKSIVITDDNRTIYGVGFDGELVKIDQLKTGDPSYSIVNDPDGNREAALAEAAAETKRRAEFDARQAERKTKTEGTTRGDDANSGGTSTGLIDDSAGGGDSGTGSDSGGVGDSGDAQTTPNITPVESAVSKKKAAAKKKAVAKK